MRTFRHWTPRYILSRIAEKQYRRSHPGLPWLTQAANCMLESLLLPADRGLEFGSGGSTLWFAQRVEHLVSVEHNPEWHARVSGWLSQKNFTHVDYHLCPGKDHPVSLDDLPEYVRVTEDVADHSLDFALVDGIYRDACALLTIDKLKTGGFLIIDNVNLHLPCKSRAPNSRTERQGPRTELWAQFLQKTSGWRKIWTSNGVSDTAFFIKG